MIATVQVADVGAARIGRALLRKPKPADVRGLRSAEVALFAPLGLTGPPPLGRAGLIAFWDDEAAFDDYLAGDTVGRRLSGGIEIRMTPLRAYGSWPGLPADVPRTRAVPSTGPVVVVTLGRLRVSQLVRFLRTSRPAEKAATQADGFIWGSAAVRPPFVATVSIWQDATSTAAYAYGQQRPAHHRAIDAQQSKDFHKESAFIRFMPTRIEGNLAGRNPFTGVGVPGPS